jgi:hypothetical protein
MKAHSHIAAIALCLALLCSPLFAQFKEGVKLEANGEPIDAEIGHFVPAVADWNSDGKKDLIIGQFKEGKIQLFLNYGTDSAPLFKEAQYLQAGGEEISLPAG